MIVKYCHVAAFDGLQQNVFVLPRNDVFEKTASIVKTAQVSEEIAQAVEGLQPQPGHRLLLVNALGAYEFWGPNKNTDAFPETGLKFGGEDYGYKTFMSANNFVFHDNKDPAKRVGEVKAAHYNGRMHRVELVIDTDLKKLAARTPEIAAKVERGEPVDLSMGCKCDYDIATCCGNKAANRSEYCDCLKKHGGQIMADGRRVVAYTPHPKFFDISYVEKGADVTAKSLQYIEKAASQESSGPGSTPISPSRAMVCPDPTMHETVSCEPEYDIPEFPREHLAAVRRLEGAEDPIGTDVLSKMASIGYAKALSTASHFGVILRPEEYQYLTLAALGQEKLARDLHDCGAVIDPGAMGTWFDPSLKTVPSQTAEENFDAKVAELLADHVPGRTLYEPFFSKRLEKASGIHGASCEKRAAAREAAVKEAAGFMTPELAAALALGYLVYRRGAPAAERDVIQKAIHDPKMARKVVAVLIPLIAAGSVVERMISYEPATKAAGLATGVVLPVAGSYLYSAYARHKAKQGRPISGIEHMFLEYPLPLAVGGVFGMQALKRRMGRTIPKSSGKISDGMQKQALDTGLVLALGSGIYRPRLHGAIGYLTDVMIGTAAAKGVMSLARALKGEKISA